MSNFAILTDSCCDLPHALLTQLDVTVLPLAFIMEQITYYNYPDNRDMSSEEFFRQLRQGQVATTAAVNVGQYQEAMEKVLEEGQDVLVLSFTSALSSCYQSATIAAEDLAERYPQRKIYVVDTLCASMGQGLLVYFAGKKRAAGASIQEVHRWAEETKLSVCHQFTVDDLGCLKRGGRISAATAVVGTMLSVKPLLQVDGQGMLVSSGKSRGRNSALKDLVKRVVDTAQPDLDTIFLSHGDCLDEATTVAEALRQHFPAAHIEIAPIGPVIGAHAGPGTVAIFYLGTQR